MPHRSSTRRQSVSFMDALGIWTMGPEHARRSSHHRRHRSHRSSTSTAESRQARLANAPPGLHLTATEWRHYADVPPGYEFDEECDAYSDCEDERRSAPGANPFRSAWSHTAASEMTRGPAPIDRRESYLNRMRGRSSTQDTPEPRLRHQVSYDATNDALFANLPRHDGQRFAGEIVVHRLREDGEGLVAETFGQTPQPQMYTQPIRESQYFNNPRQAPPIPGRDPDDEWPSAQTVYRMPNAFQSRINTWRDSIPGNSFGPEPSVFGGSNASTVWPGGERESDGRTVVPDDSLTEIMRRESRHRSGGSRAGGSRGGSLYSRRL
ncbi:hypothetical protein FSARC_9886 [Fusarium sarcochroum]|uniref:Uncharacterized protein n=1 Tax=Fusarium sarcochroum TaxID=1208366 RepID=A0A8H4TQF6_9HYPO|nr:hypothetical protein FSARC_9886 [Fusarium sarcochroum]